MLNSHNKNIIPKLIPKIRQHPNLHLIHLLPHLLITIHQSKAVTHLAQLYMVVQLVSLNDVSWHAMYYNECLHLSKPYPHPDPLITPEIPMNHLDNTEFFVKLRINFFDEVKDNTELSLCTFFASKPCWRQIKNVTAIQERNRNQ